MSNELSGVLSGAINEMLEGSIAGQIKVLGGSANLKSLSAFENGEYLPPEGYDGFDSVIVDVPIKEEVIGSITENGTHTPPEGKVYKEVVVNVPAPDTITGTFTENGTFTPPSGKVWNQAVVNVPLPDTITGTFTENGTFTPPSGKVWNQAVVNVPTFERHDGLYYKTFIEASMTLATGIYGDLQSTWGAGSSIGCTLNGTVDIRSYHKLKVSGKITNSYEYATKTNLARCQFVFGVTDQVFNNMIYVDYNTGDHIKGRNGITLTNTQDTGNFALEVYLDEIESTNLYFFMSLLGITGVFTVILE